MVLLNGAEVACWMVTGERQAARIRGLYLKTILKQDIAFFDTETTTGEVIGRMSGDTILIQDAMGEKVSYIYTPSLYQKTSQDNLHCYYVSVMVLQVLY